MAKDDQIVQKLMGIFCLIPKEKYSILRSHMLALVVEIEKEMGIEPNTKQMREWYWAGKSNGAVTHTTD